MRTAMNESDLRAVAETYGKIVSHRERPRAQLRRNAVLNVLAETVRVVGKAGGGREAVRAELDLGECFAGVIPRD